MERACRDFVVYCTVAYNPKPRFRSRWHWWSHLLIISWARTISKNTHEMRSPRWPRRSYAVDRKFSNSKHNIKSNNKKTKKKEKKWGIDSSRVMVRVEWKRETKTCFRSRRDPPEGSIHNPSSLSASSPAVTYPVKNGPWSVGDRHITRPNTNLHIDLPA